MSGAYSLPDVARAKDLLGMIFDGLSIKPGSKLDISGRAASYFGVYVTDEGAPAALCGCDTEFAAHTGSALSMLPPATAMESVKARTLTDVMRANLHEIMNICTRLILREGSPHLRLREVSAVGALPADAAALLTPAVRRIDWQVDIPRYGSGVLCVICAG
jgi:hypothetical protein